MFKAIGKTAVGVVLLAVALAAFAVIEMIPGSNPNPTAQANSAEESDCVGLCPGIASFGELDNYGAYRLYDPTTNIVCYGTLDLGTSGAPVSEAGTSIDCIQLTGNPAP